KHSHGEYDEWMRLFLETMHADVFMFTTPELADTARRLRGPLPLIVDTRWSTPKDIPPLASPKRREQLAAQQEKDREKAYHNADLYAVWAAKTFFMDTALKSQHPSRKPYSYAFWMDIGTFRRPHAFRRWPEVGAVRKFWKSASKESGTPAEDLVIVPIQWQPPESSRTWNESMGPLDIDFAIGSMFGGTPKAMEWWNKVYFTYFYHYIDRGLFVGKDQTMWNALFWLYPKRFLTVWANDPETMPGQNRGEGAGDCGGWWGYYVYWLAPPTERSATEDEFFKYVRCRRIRALSMETVLRRTLGGQWVPPVPSLPLIDPPAA
ncbi:hypothetical protein EXIGLDRAFT_611896, partial [Exidia glandulosa HHB12029]